MQDSRKILKWHTGEQLWHLSVVSFNTSILALLPFCIRHWQQHFAVFLSPTGTKTPSRTSMELTRFHSFEITGFKIASIQRTGPSKRTGWNFFVTVFIK